VARIVARIRGKWRKVRIVLRAGSGFANEELMAWCEANRVGYVFGLSRLEAALAAELAAAKRVATPSASGCDEMCPPLEDAASFPPERLGMALRIGTPENGTQEQTNGHK
jgi:Transposase DDE domain group 1